MKTTDIFTQKMDDQDAFFQQMKVCLDKYGLDELHKYLQKSRFVLNQVTEVITADMIIIQILEAFQDWLEKGSWRNRPEITRKINKAHKKIKRRIRRMR